MKGARIVLNSRYFHIAKAGEKADGKHSMTKDAAMGLVNYVGTRESVILNMPGQLSMNGEEVTSLNLDPLKLNAEVATRPATSKQMATLADLLHEIPEAKNSLEYQDYKESPTIGNASELISRAAEFGLGYAIDLGKAKNLVEYVGKRPGVDRVGEHGLFSSSPEVNIKKAQEEIADCKGNIWTHVISLRREDADALGYDTQKPWRDLVLQKIDVIAKASNIPVSELHWYAGMHNTTHHPHIHLFIFSDNPKSGKLTVDGINKMKSEFSEVIFSDERHHIYEHKTEMRDEIKHQVDELLAVIENNTADQFSKRDLDELSRKLTNLSANLKDRPGKMQYGWIKDLDIRNQVNEIVTDLAKAPAIQELYKLYCEDHKELQKMYRNDPKDIGPLLNNPEFKSIKNKIIREAVKLINISPQSDPELADIDRAPDQNPEPVYDCGYPTEISPDNTESSPLLSDEESLLDSIPDERQDYEPPEGYDQAAEWEQQEDYEPNDDSSADREKPETGSSKRSGRTHQTKEQSFDECMSEAMQGDNKAKYRLAKMYLYGSSVERDYVQAQMWYGLAAAGGNSFAKYELGKMYLYGIGIEKNTELGKEYCLDAFWDFRGSVSETYGFDIGSYVDSGTAVEEGFSGNEDATYLMYCLGRMEYAGEGVERDYSKAFQWYRLAADGKHVHSNYCLAKMYYGGEGVQQDYRTAFHYYQTAAGGKDKYAYHALGKMYDTGTGVEQNYSKAADWFTIASKGNVSYANYRLAQLYESGQGVEKDEELSSILYRKALDEFIKQEKQQSNAADEFRIANMYLHGIGIEANPEESIKWLNLCIEKEDPRAQYQLARMYQDGKNIPQDESKAQELYAAALDGFIKLEQETPASHTEYKIAGMFDRGNGTEPDAVQAFSWYVKAAENGHPHAAYRTAKACYDGTGTDQDYYAAEKWFLKAADGGDPYAMYALGKMYRDGTGIEVNPKTSYGYFLAAAKLGHEFAQFAVAKALLHGTGTEKDIPQAMYWFEKCISHGNHYAEYEVAELLTEGKVVPKDEARAQKLYAAALAGFLLQEQEKSDSQLEYRIGSMYLHRNGTEKDADTALHWLSLTAEKGNPYAAYQVSQLLEDRKAPISQINYFYQIALNGFIASTKDSPDSFTQFRIGQMFYRGKGCIADNNAAFHWFSLSAAQDNPHAQFQLARMLQNGEGVMKDERHAAVLYSQALQGFLKMLQEEPDSVLQYKIATMYEFGLGVDRDIQTAKQWYQMAVDSGNEYAQKRLDQIESSETQMAVNSIFGLLRAFSSGFGNDIKDSTTHKYRQDRKLMQKQQTLKTTHGHKYDDQEQNM